MSKVWVVQDPHQGSSPHSEALEPGKGQGEPLSSTARIIPTGRLQPRESLTTGCGGFG